MSAVWAVSVPYKLKNTIVSLSKLIKYASTFFSFKRGVLSRTRFICCINAEFDEISIIDYHSSRMCD